MSETVRVYHGSKRGLEGAIRADRGYPTNDFGAGFIYRFWNFKTGEASRAIHAQFPLAEVLSVYPGFHTLDNNRAVDEMIELARKRAA